MRWLRSRIRGASSERGATAIVVALLMTALLGAAGLAVDLGASYAKKQQLQNGADAAALAVAQEYLSDDTNPSNLCVDTSSYDQLADDWVRANVHNNEGTATERTCVGEDKNGLRVKAGGVQEHWFMPVLGNDASDVSADATVEWGTPVAGTSLPIAISSCAFEKQIGEPNLDVLVTVWMPQPDGAGEVCDWHAEYPPGGFGVLQNSECSVEIAIPEWEVGSAPGGSGWSDCKNIKDLLGETHLIPIFDSMVVDGSGKTATYHIKQFASFKLEGFQFQQGSAGTEGVPCFKGVPSEPPEWAGEAKHASCIVGIFVEYVELEDVEVELKPPSSADTFIVIRLVD